MKSIIEIIKEEIEAGNKSINIADYRSHTEKNLPVTKWEGEVPSIGETLTDGNQDMTVVAYSAIDGSVGVEMDNGINITSAQVVEMMASKVCWIKGTDK